MKGNACAVLDWKVLINVGKWLVLKKDVKDKKDTIIIATQCYLGQIGKRNIFRQEIYPQILSQVHISAFINMGKVRWTRNSI